MSGERWEKSVAENNDDLVGKSEASRLLEVDEGQLLALVEEGLLTPVDEGPEQQFRRGEVLAIREMGG